ADTRHDDLLALEARSGKLLWRQPLGEPIESEALVHRGRIYQPTAAGNVVVLEAATGRLLGRIQLGKQRLSTAPVADRTGKFIYVLGEQFNMYVLDVSNTPRCRQVYYIGHRPETIQASPLRIGRYIVLCENYIEEESAKCRIRVLLISAAGAELKELQSQVVRGWVHHPPAVSGNTLIVATDLGIVVLYSAGPPEKEAGLRALHLLPTQQAGNGPRGQAYAYMYTSRDVLVAGLKVRHFQIKTEESQLGRPKDLFDGPASQPIQASPRTGAVKALFVACRQLDSSAVRVYAIDASSLKLGWQTLLGDKPIAVMHTGRAKQLAVLTLGGNLFNVAAEQLTGHATVPKPTDRVQWPVELASLHPTLTMPDGTRVYTPSGSPRSLLVSSAADGSGQKPLRLPERLA
ncbi:MAG TPA: hypothetical protein EYP14_08320, partial [Planctomycetaceae bacterium]|nr:hypothetical protein [Planctomycetaceae bacterium]